VVLNPVRAGACALPELWPWSSYRATAGIASAPPWLQTAWLLDQFGSQTATSISAYVDHVRAGIGHADLWSHLKSQVCLGDDEFAEQLRRQIPEKVEETEIPRVQRRAAAQSLAHFLAQPVRNEGIALAYATDCYNLKEIGRAFGLHYTTVSRVVRNVEMSQYKT